MENVVNFFSETFGQCKKRNIFLNKKSMEGCFTLNNNIGFYSDKTYLDFDDAKYSFQEANYSEPVYTLLKGEGLYLSYDREYNPIITNRVYRYENSNSVTHRWIKTDEDGKILISIVINKTIK